MTNPTVADAFRFRRQGRGLVLEFGRLEERAADGQPPVVALTDRMTVSLDTARRLAISLEEALRPHAARLRAEEAKALAPAAAAVAAKPNQVSARPPEDISGARAAQLLKMVADWDVPHQYERSVQFRAGVLQPNRFLLTVNGRDIPGDALERVLTVCRAFAMPEALAGQAAERFGAANCVHFGFEGAADSIVCKLYLESGIADEEARRAAADGTSLLMHRAFKWDLLKSTAVTTLYHWFPGLTVAAIEDRLRAIYGEAHAGSLGIALALLAQSAERSPVQALQYLEVEESGTARRSFDLNVYNSRLSVRDIQPLLQQIRAHFGIRAGQFQALYDQIRVLPLGHLAGGLHRDGRDFFNLYYGAIALPHYNDKLNPA